MSTIYLFLIMEALRQKKRNTSSHHTGLPSVTPSFLASHEILEVIMHQWRQNPIPYSPLLQTTENSSICGLEAAIFTPLKMTTVCMIEYVPLETSMLDGFTQHIFDVSCAIDFNNPWAKKKRQRLYYIPKLQHVWLRNLIMVMIKQRKHLYLKISTHIQRNVGMYKDE